MILMRAMNRRVVAPRRLQDVVQQAVDAEAHRHLALEGLDVDVRRAVLDGLEEQRVDQPDDRRLVVGVEQIVRLLELVRDRVELAGLDVAHHRLGGAARAVVGEVDRLEDRRGGDHDRVHAASVERAQIIHHLRRARIGDRDAQGVAVLVERQAGEALGVLDRQARDQRRIDLAQIDVVEERQPEAVRQAGGGGRVRQAPRLCCVDDEVGRPRTCHCRAYCVTAAAALLPSGESRTPSSPPCTGAPPPFSAGSRMPARIACGGGAAAAVADRPCPSCPRTPCVR